MTRFDGIRRTLRVHFGKRGVQRAIDDEIAFHLHARVQDLVRRGLSETDANAVALREFGDVTAARRDLEAIDRRRVGRSVRREWWGDTRRDVTVGLRSLRRQPVLTAAILITLALGIGANAAIFTVMQAALLAPLPYARPDRLVHLWQTRPVENDRTEYSYPDFADLRAGTRSFSYVEGYDATNVTVDGPNGPARVQGGRVTAGFFAMLGVRPTIGRTFAAGDDVPGAPRIVLLSHGLWRDRFAADRAVVGRALTIDGSPYEIIGVLPDGFHFAPIGVTDVWIPVDRSAETRAERFNHWLNVVARLADGAALATANMELATVMRRLETAYPETNAGRSAVAVPLRDEVVGDVRPLLLVLTGAVTLVLLIACANVAGLLVARSLARTRELAVRTALGATRWRLVRQLTTESLLLAIAGGALAVWVAGAGANLLVAMIPEGTRSGLPFWSSDLGFGTRTALYSMTIAIASGVVFGLVPALSASRVSMGEALRRSGRGVAGGGARLRDALVAGEVALTIVLLVGTGLLVRSLTQLMRVDPGFDAEQVMTARIALAGPRYASDASRRTFFEDVLARVRSEPGVEAIGAVSNLPLAGGGTNTFRVVGAPEPATSARPEATMRAVAGDYFRALGIRLVAGRQFTSRDDSASRPVVMMNESLAGRLFGSGPAVGARLRFYAFPDNDWEVIGIVRDVKTTRLDDVAPPTIYYAQLQAPENRMSLAIRVRCSAEVCDPAAMTTAIRRAVAESDPTVPIYAVATMEDQITDSPAVFARRYPLLLVGLFAATALVLAVVGLYGVISYAVVQRTREFGIRLALGAPSSSIRGAVLRRGAVVAAVGVLAGVPGALALTRLMRGMLYGVTPADPMTYIGGCVLLIAVALLASWIPAHWATRIEPVVALRAD